MQHDTRLRADTAQDALDRLARATGQMGRESVEISAFFADLDRRTTAQSTALVQAEQAVDHVAEAKARALGAVEEMLRGNDETTAALQRSARLLAQSDGLARDLAQWVQSVHSGGTELEEMLQIIQLSNSQIAEIADEVNILAVNARIEAARAGQAGKGFAIVAEAITKLSQETSGAATQVSRVVTRLTAWMQGLNRGAMINAGAAERLLNQSAETDSALSDIGERAAAYCAGARTIEAEVASVHTAVEQLRPAIASVQTSVHEVTGGVSDARQKCAALADMSEAMLQKVAALGGSGEDGPMITLVQDLAGQIAQTFETALERRQIALDELFSDSYRPVPRTDPQQLMAPFTRLTDRLLPPIQDPVLQRDSRIVFCAAVDRNGYLPTHNARFSQPQGPDPVWNAAHCRNRRLFDDRVGRKAGRNEEPFLLQVYRRDMGGGTFAMMKDLSAPIRVRGRHWGGLRLAYTF